MKNPLTFNVESSLGAVFVSLLGFFFIGMLFVAIKNFDSDIDVMTATSNNIKITRVSETERLLIQEWVILNTVDIPEGGGYRYLMKKYPDRPWLD